MLPRPALQRHIEALLFSAGEPVPLTDIMLAVRVDGAAERTEADFEDALAALRDYYDDPDRTFQLQFTAGGYQLLTKPAYYPTLGQHFRHQRGKRLSTAAMETLSVIAYRQPVTRADVEAIRGVGCDYTISKLLERELVTILGRDEGPGRPLLYGTSARFMDYLGLGDLSELPKLRELVPAEDNSIGEAAA